VIGARQLDGQKSIRNVEFRKDGVAVVDHLVGDALRVQRSAMDSVEIFSK